jgi:putative transposon-encoded protein
MIYRNSYFKKELRQAYSENKVGTSSKMAFALFGGLVSFAVYFVFQTLKESVLSDWAPQIMQSSFFSTVYIYIHMAFIFNTVYFIVYYDYLFFSEIRKNSWYLLVQMRYNPVMMILSKFSALLYSVFLIYTVGFAFTVFLTIFLKYTFILAYIPVLYLAGFIDLTLISIISLTFSLYVTAISNARSLLAFSTGLIFLLKVVLGQYTILSNRVSMQNISNLFNISRSLYLSAAALIMIICCIICAVRCRNVAKYYSLPTNDYGGLSDVLAIHVDSRTGKRTFPDNGANAAKRNRIFNDVTTVGLIVFICTALVFNVFIILINTSTPGNEVAIRGVIPFVFKSDTMAPAIMLNDLAYFQKIDAGYEIKEGQIILFEENNVIYVERVIEKIGNEFKVDIDNYPPLSQTGAMLRTVPRQAVHGLYNGRNRWLGALILFANTIIGRLLFLLLPAILLFYNKQIVSYSRKKF